MACDWRGGATIPLWSAWYGGGEQLEWAVMLAVPTYDESWGEGGCCFRQTGAISSESEGTPLLAAGVLGAMGTGLLGEIHTEGCPKISSIVLEKSPSISSAMLGLVAISHG